MLLMSLELKLESSFLGGWLVGLGCDFWCIDIQRNSKIDSFWFQEIRTPFRISIDGWKMTWFNRRKSKIQYSIYLFRDQRPHGFRLLSFV